MGTSKLISIVIPVVNRGDIIPRTLDSILGQSYPHWECLVVDDGSTDNTKVVVENYSSKDSRIQFFERPDNHLPGGNGARNYGLKMSHGEYVQFFDSDDLMLPHKLERQLFALEKNKNAIVNFCSGRKVAFEAGFERSLRKDFNSSFFEQVALNTSQILTPSMLIYRSFLVEKKILFEEDLRQAQETDFYLNLAVHLSNFQISYLEEELFLYVFNGKNLTSKDGNYQHHFQYSKAKVYLKAMNMGKQLGNEKVYQKMYNKIIKILFAALRQRDRKNVIYIMTQFNNVLKPQYSFLYWKLKGVVTLNSIFLIPNYKLQSYFMNRNLSFNNKIARPQYD